LGNGTPKNHAARDAAPNVIKNQFLEGRSKGFPVAVPISHEKRYVDWLLLHLFADTLALRSKDVPTNERLQYLVYLGLSLGVAGFTSILYLQDNLFFQKFFGRINPLVTIVIIVLLGGVLLSFLLSRSWFTIYQTWNPRWLIVPSALAALLAFVIILVDVTVIFPKDMNISFPESLLFYPVMGFVVEIIFHLLPLSFLLVVLTSLSKGTSFSNIIWPCLVMVALLEPMYQTLTGSLGRVPLWATAYVFLHVFLINVLELFFFKRNDFVSMYSFRLLYYLLWHIAWGYVRLSVLF
jgi:hypothetical protein